MAPVSGTGVPEFDSPHLDRRILRREYIHWTKQPSRHFIACTYSLPDLSAPCQFGHKLSVPSGEPRAQQNQ